MGLNLDLYVVFTCFGVAVGGGKLLGLLVGRFCEGCEGGEKFFWALILPSQPAEPTRGGTWR